MGENKRRRHWLIGENGHVITTTNSSRQVFELPVTEALTAKKSVENNVRHKK